MSWLSELLERNSADPRVRLELGEKLLEQLSRVRLPSDTRSLNDLCDVIFVWLSASNFKVSLLALEILNSALDVSGDVLAPYLLERMSALVERLGDSKQQVRDAVSGLIVDLAEVPHSSYQIVLEKISPAFSHKQWLIRTGTMNLFRMLLDESREDLEIQTNRLIPTFCKLMSDPNVEVRETATSTIVHIMVILGETVATSIRNRRLVPDSKMQLLMQRYDDALRQGSVPSSVPRPVRTVRRFESRPQSASSTRDSEQENRVPRPPSTPRTSMSSGSRRPPTTSSSGRPSTAGAVSEEELRRAFTTVPKSDIYSAKELNSQIESIRTVLENENNDWNKRTNSLKLLRSVVINGGMDFETELMAGINSLELALVKSVRDLRSQVCKEACTTICFLSERLGRQMVKVCEAILPHTLALIQNSAKVMATSGAQACDFMVKNVEHPKLLPIVLANSSHKSKEMRRQTLELINQVLSVWVAGSLTKHLSALSDAVKSGISDADVGVRQAARNAYQQLDMHYPAQAQQLYKTLDPSRQKSLYGGERSAASSSQSITSMKDSTTMSRRPGSMGMNRPNTFLSGRSSSAIDTKSIQRASSAVRAAPRTPAIRPNVVRSSISGASTSRPPVNRLPMGRQKSDLSIRSTTSTLSQPSSRNTSPTRTRRARPNGLATQRTSISNLQRPLGSSSVSRGPAHAASNGSTGVAAEEVFSAINNLSLAAAASDEDDFLLGDTFSSTQRDAGLTRAIHSCSSTNFTEKRDGLKTILDLMKTGLRLRQDSINRLTLAFNKLLAEANHRLISLLSETICELVRTHHELLGQWLPQLTNKMITKHAQELLPTVKEPLNNCLYTIRQHFEKTQLLAAVCKILLDSPIQSPPPKVKHGILQFMHDLLSEMDSGVELNTPEVRGAVHKVFEWLEDPKNAGFRPTIERVICDLFTLNTAEFSLLLTTFPPAWKHYTYSLLNKTNGHDTSNSESPMVKREVPSSFNSPVPVDQTDHRARINGREPVRNGNRPEQKPMTPASHDSFKDHESPLDETTHLAYDPVAQKEYIDSLLNELATVRSEPERTSQQCKALQQLYQMIAEGSLSSWDENFGLILVRIFACLETDNVNIKKNALRLLTRACVAQAARFNDKTDLVILKVFGAVVNDTQKNAVLVNVAEECMKVLASHLPAHLVLRTLNPIIHTTDDPCIGCALKMLEKLVDNMDPDDLAPLINEVAPGVVKCYSNPESAVRKSAVFCLVAMVHKLGRELMENHLLALDVKGNKVLEIYLQRRQTASTHF